MLRIWIIIGALCMCLSVGSIVGFVEDLVVGRDDPQKVANAFCVRAGVEYATCKHLSEKISSSLGVLSTHSMARFRWPFWRVMAFTESSADNTTVAPHSQHRNRFRRMTAALGSLRVHLEKYSVYVAAIPVQSARGMLASPLTMVALKE